MLWRYRELPAEQAPDYPEDMPPRMLVYSWFSEVKGWDPRIVDNLTLEELEWFPMIKEASHQVSDIISKEMEAQNRRQRLSANGKNHVAFLLTVGTKRVWDTDPDLDSGVEQAWS